MTNQANNIAFDDLDPEDPEALRDWLSAEAGLAVKAESEFSFSDELAMCYYRLDLMRKMSVISEESGKELLRLLDKAQTLQRKLKS